MVPIALHAAARCPPEILVLILENLSTNKTTLCAASAVNRLWWHCATPLLWRDVTSCALEHLAAARRSHYARMIERLTYYFGSADIDADKTYVEGQENSTRGYDMRISRESTNSPIASHDFPRLSDLRIVVRHYYSPACDPAIVRFLHRRCPALRLAHVEVSLMHNSLSNNAISPMLLGYLARREGVTRLAIQKLQVPLAALDSCEEARRTETLAADAAAHDFRAQPKPYFIGLQSLTTGVAPEAAAALVHILPATLAALHLNIFDRGRYKTASDYDGPTYRAEEAVAERARHLPNLRELVLLYESGWDDAASFVVLRSLSRLELLKIGWWNGGGWGDRCPCCAWSCELLPSFGFGDDELAHLVAGLPRLKHLSLAMAAEISETALRQVGRACPQLEHLELFNYYDMYEMCHEWTSEYQVPGPILSNLKTLRLAGIEGFTRFDKAVERAEGNYPRDKADEEDMAGEMRRAGEIKGTNIGVNSDSTGDRLYGAGPENDHVDAVIQRGGGAYRMYEALRQIAPNLHTLSFSAGFVDRRELLVAWLLAHT